MASAFFIFVFQDHARGCSRSLVACHFNYLNVSKSKYFAGQFVRSLKVSSTAFVTVLVCSMEILVPAHTVMCNFYYGFNKHERLRNVMSQDIERQIFH